jgi:hypothetical protein
LPANSCSGYLRDRKVGEVAAPARLLLLYLLQIIRKKFLLSFERQHFELKVYRPAIPVCASNNILSKRKLRQQKATTLQQLVIHICIKCTNVVSHTMMPSDTQLVTTANIQAGFSMPFRCHILFIIVILSFSAHN